MKCKKRRVHLADTVAVMHEKLAGGGDVILTITGNSMAPMLHHRKDRVCLKKASNTLKKYDFVLFIRESTGAFVAHRVVSVNADGSYNLCGDNQYNIERGVAHKQIVGVVTGFWRDGKYRDCTDKGYRFYCRVWCALFPIRYVYLRTKSILKRLKKH